MAGYIATVAPGPGSTQLGGGTLAPGTVIANLDSTNSVWVSSSRNVVPGSGTLLGPLGTMTWQTPAGTSAPSTTSTGTQAFAVVDTGVTTPVQLNVSGDISNLQNPVAIGAAIAVELIEQGIRINYTDDELYANVIAAPLIGFNTAVFDIAEYSSAEVSLSLTSTVAPNDYVTVTISFFLDEAQQFPLGSYIYIFWANQVVPTGNNRGGGLIVVPVRGSYMQVTLSANSSSGNTLLHSLLVTGSTRSIDESTIVNNVPGANGRALSIAASTTAVYYLPTVARALQLVANTSAATVSALLLTNGGAGQRIVDDITLTALPSPSVPLSTQGEAPSLQITNGAVTASAINISVTDAS